MKSFIALDREALQIRAQYQRACLAHVSPEATGAAFGRASGNFGFRCVAGFRGWPLQTADAIGRCNGLAEHLSGCLEAERLAAARCVSEQAYAFAGEEFEQTQVSLVRRCPSSMQELLEPCVDIRQPRTVAIDNTKLTR